MRLPVLGLTALAVGIGAFGCIARADAQLYFNYSTTYTTAASSADSTLGQTAFVPDNPINTAHPYLVVTPNGGTGLSSPASINLITLTPTVGMLGLTDTQTVTVNQDFAVQFNLAQASSSGKQIGSTGSVTYKGTLTGFLKVDEDTVAVTPAVGQPSNVSVTSGSGKYNISLSGLSVTGMPGQQLGALAATVIGSEGGVSIVPEPGSLALFLGAALPGTIIALKVRRRR